MHRHPFSSWVINPESSLHKSSTWLFFLVCTYA